MRLLFVTMATSAGLLISPLYANTSTSPLTTPVPGPVDANPYEAAWSSGGMEAARIIIYSTIIVVAFVGNLLLVGIIASTRQLRSATNHFLFNMALGDLLVSVVCMPIELIRWFHPHIIQSDAVCKSFGFLQGVAVGVSVFSLLAMAVDRYIAILNPFGKRLGRLSIRLIIVLIWISAILIYSPTLHVSSVRSVDPHDPMALECGEFGWQHSSQAAHFTYVILVMEYILPLFVMSAIYFRLFLFLSRRKIPGYDELPADIRQRLCLKQTRRKRVLRMLVAVVVTFAACHLPQHVMSMLWYVGGDDLNVPPYMMFIGFSSEVMLYLNSALNPILYAFLHRKFQTRVIALWHRVLCREKPPRINHSRNTMATTVSNHYRINSGLDATPPTRPASSGWRLSGTESTKSTQSELHSSQGREDSRM